MSVPIINNTSGFILVSGYEYINDGNNTITLQIPENYIVLINPYLTVQYLNYYQTYSFTQNGNTFTLTLNDVNTNDIVTCELYGNCEEDTQLISDFPTVRCYSVDKTKMTSLMNERFYRLSNNNYIDLSQYVLNYIRYPFSISKTENENQIILGYVSTSVNAKQCTHQLYEVELFNQYVYGETNTSNDINSSIIIFELPFIARKEIDSKYINTQIRVVYKTDILTNKTSVMFYSNNVLIDSVDTTIGYNIPYTLKYEEIKSFNNSFNNNLNKNISPKCIVMYKPVIENTLDNPTYKVDYVHNYTGKLWVKEFRLLNNNNLKYDDSILLKNIFKNGVIIKPLPD